MLREEGAGVLLSQCLLLSSWGRKGLAARTQDGPAKKGTVARWPQQEAFPELKWDLASCFCLFLELFPSGSVEAAA